jgi:hypothetical protein
MAFLGRLPLPWIAGLGRNRDSPQPARRRELQDMGSCNVQSFSYSVYCIAPTGTLLHDTWVFADHFVTAEGKIRELCTQVLAAENDEAANRILPELRDALHENCEKLRLLVARKYPFHKDDMAAD